jgi:hypothetical protein
LDNRIIDPDRDMLRDPSIADLAFRCEVLCAFPYRRAMLVY